MKKRILLLSYYFEPDLSAGSYRATALARALLAEGGDRVQVDVITTMPNRYHSFQGPATSVYEERGALKIRRIVVPEHRSGFVDQARSFLAYARGVSKETRHEHYDLVIATSSRLMTATLGAVLVKRRTAPLYLDIRDILVDTLPELIPWYFGKAASFVFSLVERWTVARATKMNLVSPAFLMYFKLRYPKRSFSTYPNGVDEIFQTPYPPPERLGPTGPVQVVYAGNIGAGQGLHRILPVLAKRLEGEAHFRVVGDGSARSLLVEALADSGVHNVEIMPPVERRDLLRLYQSADVLFLHLNNFRAFKRVLPSKLFEYAATGKPIWAGVAGYPASFTRKKIPNAALFDPCDVEGAIATFRGLEFTVNARDKFVNVYSRSAIMKLMAKSILGVIMVPGNPQFQTKIANQLIGSAIRDKRKQLEPTTVDGD